MLAGVRARSVVCFFCVFSLVFRLPVQAQLNGVPPSVTSMGFGGRMINGVPPSVTSIGFGGRLINGAPASVTALGPKAYSSNWSIFENCCSDFFFPAKHGLPLTSGHNRRHHRGDHGSFAVGVMEPVYVPYSLDAVDDDASDVDADARQSPGPLPAGKRPPHRIAPPDGSTTEESVTIQPSTVLVFKDGHQSDVINYAIVGDTLFDFADGRARKILLADLDLPATQKANDDRGVDFQIPTAARGQ